MNSTYTVTYTDGCTEQVQASRMEFVAECQVFVLTDADGEGVLAGPLTILRSIRRDQPDAAARMAADL